MAEADIDAIIATPDDDVTWGDDMRGAFTTIRKDRMSEIPLDLTRFSGTQYRTPTRDSGSTNTQQAASGTYYFVLSYVMGGYTPATVALANVGTAAGTVADLYYVIAEIDPDDGLPGDVAASWGPFSCTTTGTKTLTSQTTAMPESGWYWVGTMASSANDGTPTFDALNPINRLFGEADERFDGINNSSAGTTVPASLSAVTGWGQSRFVKIPHILMR